MHPNLTVRMNVAFHIINTMKIMDMSVILNWTDPLQAALSLVRSFSKKCMKESWAVSLSF